MLHHFRHSNNAELDEWRTLSAGATQYLENLEQRERESTGIDTLKIGFNAVHGYYIQISQGQAHKAPIHYVRRQTLKNAERYIIPELKEYEDKVLKSKGAALALEKQLYDELFDLLLPHLGQLQLASLALSELDVLVNLAERAETLNYVAPQFSNEIGVKIKNGRHPVVEQVLKDPFIANPVNLNQQRHLLIITGPNMGGKSTYMRQTALITLMAYIGSFVPADSAVIGQIDRIFTRIGASDDLASGRSTFMVEMTEVANILRNATPKSLLILDEIGRGTSTFDGLSIAWAVVEYIANTKLLGAKTLFATHYHELTELEGTLDGVNNYCIAVKENGDDIVFLRKIIKGGADKSYGIQVAKLAGVPEVVIERAKEIAAELEESDITANTKNIGKKHTEEVEPVQISLFDTMGMVAEQPKKSEVEETLKKLDISNMTPMEAMNQLYELQKKCK